MRGRLTLLLQATARQKQGKKNIMVIFSAFIFGCCSRRRGGDGDEEETEVKVEEREEQEEEEMNEEEKGKGEQEKTEHVDEKK